MATVARDYVSNGARKIRAGRPDGIGLPAKGNVRSTSTNGKLYRDTKPAFSGQVYRVDPYVEIDGVFFDATAKKAAKAPRVAQASKAPARRRRTDPGPGTRTSLSSIRAKG